jgi:hypothetical protein
MKKETALRLADHLNTVNDCLLYAGKHTSKTDTNLARAISELEASCRILASEIDSINSYLRDHAQP